MPFETHGLLDSQLLTKSSDLSLSVLLCIGQWTLLFYKQGFNPITGKILFLEGYNWIYFRFGHFRKRIVTLSVINQPKKSLCILKYFCLCPTLHRSFQNAPNFFKI